MTEEKGKEIKVFGYPISRIGYLLLALAIEAISAIYLLVIVRIPW